jgi:hypothetical protein
MRNFFKTLKRKRNIDKYFRILISSPVEFDGYTSRVYENGIANRRIFEFPELQIVLLQQMVSDSPISDEIFIVRDTSICVYQKRYFSKTIFIDGDWYDFLEKFIMKGIKL